MIKVPPSGPPQADILIVGEAPGHNETLEGEPFVGASGQELNRMLHEAGILRTECRIVNACPYKPPGDMDKTWLLSNKTQGRARGYTERYGLFASPEIMEGLDELADEIERCNPNLIILLGKTALWALAGETSITKWRGSCLLSLPEFGSRKIIPTYHPAAILRMWAWRWAAVHDLRRCATESVRPELPTDRSDFTIQPTFQQTMEFLTVLLSALDRGREAWIACDIETVARHIACVGLAISNKRAICIPFMTRDRAEGYWPSYEEEEVLDLLRAVLTHPRARVFGQGFWYDMQYLVRYFGIWPRVVDDTMLMHHVCFPGTPMDLGYLSSLYCENHVYWKDELTDYKKLPLNEHQFWNYNCKDAVRTFEIRKVLDRVIDQLELRPQYNIQMALFEPVLKMMLRGVRCDMRRKQNLALELMDAMVPREQFLIHTIGLHVGVKKPTKLTANWYKSPKQTQALLYDEMGLPVQKNKKTRRPTADDGALQTLTEKEPLIAPLTQTITELRSLGVFLNTFVNMSLDHDKRIHCSYKIPGTETFRFSSSEDAFGFGTNLQNIPAGSKE